MATRKPLFFDDTNGFNSEMATTDDIVIGGLSSSGDIALTGGAEVTGLPSTPGGTTAATSKAYVDSLVDGLGWTDPCAVMNLIGNASVATINGLSPSAGDAYVMTDAGTLTAGSLSVAAGDLVEFDGSAWVKVVTNSGGYPPAGTRAVLSTSVALISPYTDATDDGKIVEFSGSSLTGTDTSEAVNHAAFLVQTPNNDGYYENQGYTFEGTVPTGSWVLWSGAGTVNAGAGLTKSGNTLNVGAGNGITVSADAVAVDADSETGGNIQPVNITANGVGVDINAIAGTGIEADGSANLRLAAQGNGIAGGAGSTLSVDPDSETGGNIEPVTVGANGVGVDINSIAGTGLEADGSANLRIAASAAGDGLTGGGGSALAVNLEASNPTLKITTDELGVKYDSNKGLTTGASGMEVKVDGTTVSFDGSGQLQAVGSAEAQRVENDFAVDEAIAAADPVYWTSTGDRVGKADAASAQLAKSHVFGVARTAQSTVGQTSAIVSIGQCAGILSSATPGTRYWLQSGGGIGTSRPSASGERLIHVGMAMNADDLWVELKDFGRRA
jgi:hypothetical protein